VIYFHLALEKGEFSGLYLIHTINLGFTLEFIVQAIRRTQVHHLLGLILRMQVLQLSKLINYFSNNALICASVLA